MAHVAAVGVPRILMGVADHPGPLGNESLHLGDWVKAMRSTIHLYDALAACRGGSARTGAP